MFVFVYVFFSLSLFSFLFLFCVVSPFCHLVDWINLIIWPLCVYDRGNGDIRTPTTMADEERLISKSNCGDEFRNILCY